MKHWRKFAARAAPALKALWAFLNSPLIITLVSGLLIAAIARGYATRETAAKDIQDRRNKLTTSLAEFQQRVSYLQVGNRMWKARCDYPSASLKEWEAITGTGSYVPTSPAYRGVHLSVVMNDVEISSGVPDLRYGVAMFMGVFSVPPPRTAWWVRGQLEWLENYGSNRSFLLAIGDLPVGSGQVASEWVNTFLELPGSTPALRAKMRRETEEKANRLSEELRKASKEGALAPCPEPPPS